MTYALSALLVIFLPLVGTAAVLASVTRCLRGLSIVLTSDF